MHSKEKIADDAVALVKRVRTFLYSLDGKRFGRTLSVVDNMIDQMRDDLKGNCFVDDDAVDVKIHDMIWMLEACDTMTALQSLCTFVLAKVQIFAMDHSNVKTSRFSTEPL